jgi:hypothetical protein
VLRYFTVSRRNPLIHIDPHLDRNGLKLVLYHLRSLIMYSGVNFRFVFPILDIALEFLHISRTNRTQDSFGCSSCKNGASGNVECRRPSSVGRFPKSPHIAPDPLGPSQKGSFVQQA